MGLKSLTRGLAHGLPAGGDVDDPETTIRRRRIIQEKAFLRRVYEEWYTDLAGALPAAGDRVLEIGSGAGFFRERVPALVASDVMVLPQLDVVLDAAALPFRRASLGGIVMVNVLHHLTDVRSFFRDAARCVKAGGAIVMLEPWVSRWSRFVYGRLHHEPFAPDAPDWSVPPGGPLSGANSALPWIVFVRDRRRFEAEFPEWGISSIELRMPFRYLLSGGMSMRALMPAVAFPLWRWIERRLERHYDRLAMFARIVLVRRESREPFHSFGPAAAGPRSAV